MARVALALFADFDQVSFGVTDFEELRITTVLNRPNENAATGK